MTTPVGVGLARVTIAAPKRRIDVALPESVMLAELLPNVLWHAGEGAADEGETHGGWVLRRMSGTPLEPGRTLAAQDVRDGEVLYLAPRRSQWPELEYDDVVEAIASGARRYGRSWGRSATRRAGLVVASVLFLLGLLDLLLSPPPWVLPGGIGLFVAAILTVVGITMSRAMADAIGGAVVAGAALPYGFVGGFLLLGPGKSGLDRFGAPHLLLGSVVLLVLGIVAYTGVAAMARLFSAAVVVGLLGMIGGVLGMTSLSAAGATAITVAIGVALMPGFPLLAARLGKLPFPTLPARAEEMLEDQPVPPRPQVFASVARSDELLTGLLLGVSIVAAAGSVLLAASGQISAIILSLIVSLALLLRARLFPIARQRVPLIASGVLIFAVLQVGAVLVFQSQLVLLAVLVVTGLVGTFVLISGLLYSKRPPSPYMGRFADVFDVLAIIALVPVTCIVVGLYSGIQSMFASF